MITNNNYQALEPQFLCDVCKIAVTNPLCPTCLATEVDAWTTLYPALRKELIPKLNLYLRRLKEKAEESTQCIKCGNKSASVCPYCFTNHVFKELKTIEANKIILKEFFEFFNYDLEHEGYSKEAEKLGVI